MVRYWCGTGAVLVRYRCGTGAVRYFNFFLSGTVHVGVIILQLGTGTV